MELKKLSDPQLAARAVDYIGRLDALMEDVSAIKEGRSAASNADRVRELYKQLKTEMKEDARQAGLANNLHSNRIVLSTFGSNILEAVAFGMQSPSNSKVDDKLCQSLEEAHYKMCKHYGLDGWKDIAQST